MAASFITTVIFQTVAYSSSYILNPGKGEPKLADLYSRMIRCRVFYHRQVETKHNINNLAALYGVQLLPLQLGIPKQKSTGHRDNRLLVSNLSCVNL